MRSLREICPGYYVKEFVLFPGESIHYYIQEESYQDMVLTQSGQLEGAESCVQEGRYDRLCEIRKAYMEERPEDARRLEASYEQLEKITEQLFG